MLCLYTALSCTIQYKQSAIHFYMIPTLEEIILHIMDVLHLFSVEAQRQVQDYKFKLKKAEQDITTLEGNVSTVYIRIKSHLISQF